MKVSDNMRTQLLLITLLVVVLCTGIMYLSFLAQSGALKNPQAFYLIIAALITLAFAFLFTNKPFWRLIGLMPPTPQVQYSLNK